AFSMKAQYMNCANFCVLNITNLDTITNEVDVVIYNGDTNHVNYPTVVLVDGAGDTVGNINNQFYLFAQMAGDTVYHTIPTTLDSIPAGFTCTVYFTDQVWDTTCMFNYPMSCAPMAVYEFSHNDHVTVYPNPARDEFTLSIENGNEISDLRLVDISGKELRKFHTAESKLTIQRENLN